MKKLSDAKFRNLNDGLLDYLHVKKVENIQNSELFTKEFFNFASPRFEEVVRYMAAYGLQLSREDELICMISLLHDETLHNQFLLMFDYKIVFSESFINMIVQAVVTLQLDEEFLVRLVKNKYFLDNNAIQLVALAFLREIISEKTMKLVLRAASAISSETFDIMIQSKIDILVKVALKMRFPGFDYRKYLK